MPDKKITLFPEIVVQNRLPRNILDQDLKLFEHAVFEKIPASHYWRLNNALLLKDTVFRKFRFWDKYSHLTSLGFISRIKRLLLLFFKKKRIEKGVWITDNWSSAYFHWFTDALTKLEAVSPYLSDHIILLPENLKQFKFINQSLQLLKHPYIFLKELEPGRINDLLLPSSTALTGNFNPEIISRLRKKLVAGEISGKPFRKIYISRQRAKYRKLLNEEQLLFELKKFNFEIHFFEDYSLDKQIKLINECALLVCAHGAGLTNMLFMQRGNSVIEFRKVNEIYNNCYFSMASALDLNYYYIKCQSTKSVTQLTDFILDQEEMKKLTTVLSDLA